MSQSFSTVPGNFNGIPRVLLGMTEGRGKEFDGTLPNPHFLRLRRLRFHLQVGGLIRAAGEFMQELSYAIVTPYSMRKSRTGGIVSRPISRTGLDVVAGRMFAPSAELVKRYAETIVTETESRHRATQELIREYVRRNFTGEINGQRPRVLFLVFRCEDAVAKVPCTVGHL